MEEERTNLDRLGLLVLDLGLDLDRRLFDLGGASSYIGWHVCGL